MPRHEPMSAELALILEVLDVIDPDPDVAFMETCAQMAEAMGCKPEVAKVFRRGRRRALLNRLDGMETTSDNAE